MWTLSVLLVTLPVYEKRDYCCKVMEVFSKIYLALLMLQTLVQSAPRHPRSSVAESPPSYFYNHIDGNPEVYSFGYDVSDPDTGNIQFRLEDRYPNGTVVGNYGYIDANGMPQKYRYVADEHGYRVFQDIQRTTAYPLMTAANENESSVTWTRPRKPNKEKNSNLLSKLGFENRNDVHYTLQNPSYYVEY